MKIPKFDMPSMPVLGGVMVLGAIGYFYFKGSKGSAGNDGYGGGGFFQNVGVGLGTTAADAVNGVVSGVALGIGDAVGVPRTNKTKCEQAKADGRTWDASFDCSAGDFLKYVFSN